MTIPSFRNTLSSLSPNDITRDMANSVANKLTALPKFDLMTEPENVDNEPALPSLNTKGPDKPEGEDLRKAFQDFVGQTLFSQMIGSMRSTTHGAAYFNGGQAEKIFQGQLDQILSEKLSEASASKISDPMFKLFQLRRGQ